MLKKLLLVSIAAALVLAAIAPASAAARTYYGAVVQVPQAAFGNNVYYRSFDPAYDNPAKNPTGGSAACVSSAVNVGFDAATRSCQLRWASQAAGGGGYRGVNDDIFNSTGSEGLRGVVFDAVTGTGASRAGYYFAASGPVLATGQPNSNFTALGCAGTIVSTCLGMGENANATGTGIPSTPLGTVAPQGGFRPIPVPIVTSSNKDTGVINLTWGAAAFVGQQPMEVSYELYKASKATCDPPTSEAEYTLVGPFAGAAGAQVTVPTGAGCHYFALRLVYPSAGSWAMKSRYLSANSAGVAFGGIAASVTGLTARAVGGQGISVGWNTSLEDGLKGFYVTRAIGTGSYERVSGLIAAKGQPSAYTYIDSTTPVGQARAKGVFYKIQTVDIDDQIQEFGPVKAELGHKTDRPTQLRQKPVTSH